VHLDEVFCTINGKRQYLWRAVDQDGNFLDILLTSRRDAKAATRFFRTPATVWPHRRLMPSVQHCRLTYLNSRAENSHQPTRQEMASRCATWNEIVGLTVCHLTTTAHPATAPGRLYNARPPPS
jgi:transposase-like protein